MKTAEYKQFRERHQPAEIVAAAASLFAKWFQPQKNEHREIDGINAF
jgi:hypothetical protein